MPPSSPRQGESVMNIDSILHALHAKPTPKGSCRSWIARRPVHDDRTPSLSLRRDNDGRLLWHCHGGCSQSSVGDALRRLGYEAPRKEQSQPERPKPEPPQDDDAKRIANARFLWHQAVDPRGTLAETYLNSR